MPAWAIPAGLSVLGNLLQNRSNNRAPTYAPPQGARASDMPTYQGVGGYRAPAFGFQPTRDPLYGGLSSQFGQVQQGQSALPEAYRQAVLNQATRGLDLSRQRAGESAAERMNKMGLLGSGAHGIQQGYLDEAYAREQSNLQDSLMQADLAERSRLIEQLMGIQGMQQPYEMQTQQNAQFGYNAAADQARQQYQSQVARQQAMADEYNQQYAARAGQNQQRAGSTGDLFQNLVSAYQHSQAPDPEEMYRRWFGAQPWSTAAVTPGAGAAGMARNAARWAR